MARLSLHYDNHTRKTFIFCSNPLQSGTMSIQSKKKVIVGMSGGVDSSVAALLLLKKGYEVEGLFMKNWEEEPGQEDNCSADDDLVDAQAVAMKLGIRLHTVNFATEYWDKVFTYFLAEYKAGRTPNPDIMCNTEIKFKAFLDYALELGADFIATGHYAQLEERGGKQLLLKGLDDNKDQTYFLYALNQHQLKHALFPVGELEKPYVRELAEEADLRTAKKKDSTGICFIGERKFKDFLNQYLPAQPGLIKTPEGETVGKHQGLMFYTIGQRQGLGIGGTKNKSEAPWYVLEKDLENNILIAGQDHEHPLLMKLNLSANQLTWISGEEPSLPFSCFAKTRYRQQDQACVIEKIENEIAFVSFESPQRAITPGQSIVFYNKNICLGGGIITA
jgi:tRNA-uridine 2-sulfurtransferase